MTNDLTTRLLAAIDETERTARIAQDCGDAWTTEPSRTGKWQILREVEDSMAIGYIATGRLEIDHIVRHDPAAILRRCAADRKIVAECRSGPILTDELATSLGDVIVALLAEGYGIGDPA